VAKLRQAVRYLGSSTPQGSEADRVSLAFSFQGFLTSVFPPTAPCTQQLQCLVERAKRREVDNVCRQESSERQNSITLATVAQQIH
jgi:hypothetical protein